jgi:branched-chain amino acid transport system substrate-binding protein
MKRVSRPVWLSALRRDIGHAFAVAVLLSGWLAGCGSTASDQGTARTGLDADARARADGLFAELQQEFALRRDEQVLALADELLNRYTAFARNDEVLQLAIESSQRLGTTERARRLVDTFLQRFPDSPLVVGVARRGVDFALAAGDTTGAAGLLIAAYDLALDRAAREAAYQQLDALMPAIGSDARRELFAAHSDSELWTYLGYQHVALELAQGRSEQAAAAVATMRAAGADDTWSAAAAGLVAAGKPPADYLVIGDTRVQADLLGILCPTTGRFALLGNAFFDGAQLAADRVNEMYGTTFQLRVEDSEADPVAAALATRRLCDEVGVIAVIGALMSAPTAAAAVAAEACGVPLVSPTATNNRIWELGGAIFQTNQTEALEIQLLARLACDLLLKKRFAVIHPRSTEGERTLETFTTAVEELGGEIVASVAFAPETTDFREPITSLKQLKPEVLFVPASVDQTILLGPQLDFFSVGTVILGPSAWNTPKLLEKTGAVMEGAVFPSDQAFFPAEWTSDFTAFWRQEQYPAEATPLALRAYQATRMVLDTLAQSGVRERVQLAGILQQRLSSREIETEGPESFARNARIIHDGAIIPFPAHLFAEGWAFAEAAADSFWPDADESPQVGVEPDG